LRLSATARLYLCPARPERIAPDFDASIGEVLRRDPQAEVVMTAGSNAARGQRLLARLQREIPDVAERVHLAPWTSEADLLSLLGCVDVVLDPPDAGTIASCLDAFALGKPVVTLPSEFQRGRHALACYRLLGIEECIATSTAEYVDLAVRLANDRAFRATVQAKIERTSPALFESAAAARELESFFVETVAAARRTQR
jgi:predicted O-linked N-acetylglucosamine transferase (SPINDLY family)